MLRGELDLRRVGAILSWRAGTRLLVLCALFCAAYASPALATDFQVTSTADGTDPVPTGSLRAAIIAANATPGADTISFDLGPAIGVYQIAIAAALPAITDPVTIDGTTQLGYATSPVVDIDGGAVGSDLAGLFLSTGSDGSTIRALTLRGFVGDGNGIGIRVASGGNQIVGNYIGTDFTGLVASPNATGILVEGGAENVIGGVGLQQNVIAANSKNGVEVDTDASATVIGRNLIGIASNGDSPLGNGGDGIALASSTNSVTDNGIANNGGAGVLVSGGVGNRISQNSIHDNGGLGIDLAPGGVTGPTANDPGDADTGPNNLQNATLIDSVSPNSVTGTLNSNANTTENIVEVFTSPTCDGSGFGEGRTYLGSTTVNVGDGGSGAWGFETTDVANGEGVTAVVITPNGDTSEFSQCVVADFGGTAPDGSGTITVSPSTFAPGSTGNALTFTYTAADGGMSGGALSLTVPSGWSAPSISGTDPGYTTTNNGDLNVDGSTIYVTNITLAGGESMTITYGDHTADGPGATAPSVNGMQEWPTQQASTSSGTATTIAPPTTVVGTPLSNLNVSVTPTSIGAGIKTVKLADIPNAWLAFVSGSSPNTTPSGTPPTSSTPVGSIPVGSIPVGSIPVGSIPVGSIPVGSIPVGSIPVGSIPVGSIPVGSIGLLDLPVGSIGLSSLLLSQLPLCGDVPAPGTSVAVCKADRATWGDVLSGTPFAGKPLNALSLSTVVQNASVKSRLSVLPLKDVSFVTTLLKSVHWSSLLIGPARLESLPAPGFDSWCGGANPALSAGDCAAITPTTSVLQADIEGHLGSAPVGSIPVGSIPVGSIPVGSISIAATDVAASRLASVQIGDIAQADLPAVVDCTKLVACATKTLGDAYAQNAIVPTVTFLAPQLARAFANANITVNDILSAIINKAGGTGLPWENLDVQGLQPYSGTPTHVTYTESATVDCSVVGAFSFSTRLPDGFFPVGGTAKVTFGAGTPQDAGTPVVEGSTADAASKLNTYTWPFSCGEGVEGAQTVSLSFDSFVGLRLGTFTTRVTARGGNVRGLVGRRRPGDSAAERRAGNRLADTAQAVGSDTLVVGHIAVSGDQDFYNLSLDDAARDADRGVPPHAAWHRPRPSPAEQACRGSRSFSRLRRLDSGLDPIEDNGVGFMETAHCLRRGQTKPVGSIVGRSGGLDSRRQHLRTAAT